MLNPFDSEFLSQELRETWKKVEELEKENKELKEKHKVACDYIEWCGRTITKLLEAEKELQEQLDFYEGQEELREWNREQYGDY